MSCADLTAAPNTCVTMMAMAGKITVAEVEEIVEPGALDPNHIHVPGIYVKRIIKGQFQKRIERTTLQSS